MYNKTKTCQPTEPSNVDAVIVRTDINDVDPEKPLHSTTQLPERHDITREQGQCGANTFIPFADVIFETFQRAVLSVFFVLVHQVGSKKECCEEEKMWRGVVVVGGLRGIKGQLSLQMLGWKADFGRYQRGENWMTTFLW